MQRASVHKPSALSRTSVQSAGREPARTDAGPALGGAHTAVACPCGGGCPRCAGASTRPAAALPPGIEVGRVDDPLEHDADRIATAVLGARPTDDGEDDGQDDGEDETHGDGLPRLHAVRLLTGGRPLPTAIRRFFERRLGIDLRDVRVHTGRPALDATRTLGARAFALGTDLVFADGAFDPAGDAGRRLLAHELAHTLQQGSVAGARRRGAAALPPWTARPLAARRRPLVQRTPDCVTRTVDPAAPPAAPSPAPTVADDATVDRAVEWPDACERNRMWWMTLHLTEAHVVRDLDPERQARAWANRVLRAQRLLYASGTQRVEGARLDRDGVLGPRTFLALVAVAENANHPARADLQGLGFDLDVIRDADDATLRARVFARQVEIELQTRIDVLGESAVRYYDLFYSMVATDQTLIDVLLFGGVAPPTIRRADRVELLQRLYGRNERRLQGTAALVRARRDFIFARVDVARAVQFDRRRDLDQSRFFTFSAVTRSRMGALNDFFNVGAAILAAARRLPPDQQREVDQLVTLFPEDDEPASGAREIAAVLVAIYLPAPDPAARTAVVDSYLTERAERERAERTRIEEHNRDAARQRADVLVQLIEAEDMYHPTRMVRLQSALETQLGQAQFFDLVLDDLRARPGNLFDRLYDVVTAEAGDRGLGTLVELSLAGRYRDAPRVQQALRTLIDHHHGRRQHGYVVAGDGAVLLDGTTRLEVGQVAGDRSVLYLRDEDREQLKPESRQRLEAALEAESRAYIARLLDGSEPVRSQDEAGQQLLQRAWQSAHLDPDHDIEDVEWQESIRLLGVRPAAPRADGVPRYDVQYEVVQRIVGGVGGSTPWAAVGSARTAAAGTATPPVAADRGAWHSEADFEYALFWYSYSQQADVMIAYAKVVVIGSTIIVAWEVGAISALVAAGGGVVPVSLSIGISLAIYMITHERWTLEGLLLAGIEGYLAAVGFRVFAPAGRVVSRLVIPATLEQVAFRRVVAAFLLRHGTVGALTGGTVGPASLFVEDLLRVAIHGGSFSSVGDYLRRAGTGALLGAMFEIAGSALLAPLFHAADASVLARVSDVVEALRGRQPPLTAGQWLSEAAGALSQFHSFLGNIVDDAIANGIWTAFREQVAAVSTAWVRGVRGTLQREILDLAGVTLGRPATNGLERLLRLGRGTLNDDALATMLQQARRSAPARIDPWLSYLAGVDETAVTAMAGRNQIRGLLDAEAVLTLAGRRTAAELNTLMTARFADSLDDLERFAARVNRLPVDRTNEVLDALRTRGTAVTPRALLRIAESGAPVADDVLGGLQRMLDRADPARVEAVLEAMADDQVAVFVRAARTAPPPELDAMRRVVAAHDAAHVAWAVRLPIAEAETLLTQLSAEARAVITDIAAAEARALVGAVGIDRVNRALSLGTGGPMRGTHLRTLQQRLPQRVVEDVLDAAGGNAGKLARVARVAANYDAALARLPGAQLRAGALVLDSNARAALDDLMRGFNKRGEAVNAFADLDQNYRTAIDAMRGARGLGPYVDVPPGVRPTLSDVLGPGVDLRTPPLAGAEAVGGEVLSGQASRVLPSMRGVTPNRLHPDYADVVNDMASGGSANQIGGAKGGVDRAVVADAMFAETAGGARPNIVSVDEDVVTRLARRFVTAPRTFTPGGRDTFWNQLIERFPEGRFTIEVRGHALDVIFHAPTGRTPVPP